MKFRVCQGMLAALLVVITLVYPLLAPTPHRIDPSHFQHIVKGITIAEVERIFGVSAGNYDSAELDWERALSPLEMYSGASGSLTGAHTVNGAARIDFAALDEESRRTESWTSRHGHFSVTFDKDGRVEKIWQSELVRQIPLWEQFQRWVTDVTSRN